MSKIILTQGKFDPIIITTSDNGAFSILQAILNWKQSDTKNIFPKLLSPDPQSEEDLQYPTKLSFVEIPELTILTTDQGALIIIQLLFTWRFADDDYLSSAGATSGDEGASGDDSGGVFTSHSPLNMQKVKKIFHSNPDGSIEESKEEKKARISDAVRRISIYQKTGVDPGPKEEDGVEESKNDL